MANNVVGLNTLQANLNKFVFDLDRAIDDAVFITATKVQASAIESIRTPSGGEKITTRGITHIQSKKGEAPNTDTGLLIGSIQVEHTKGAKIAFVGTDLEYGLFLETVHDRPWLEPAKDAEVLSFSKNMAAALDLQIRNA